VVTAPATALPFRDVTRPRGCVTCVTCEALLTPDVTHQEPLGDGHHPCRLTRSLRHRSLRESSARHASRLIRDRRHPCHSIRRPRQASPAKCSTHHRSTRDGSRTSRAHPEPFRTSTLRPSPDAHHKSHPHPFPTSPVQEDLCHASPFPPHLFRTSHLPQIFRTLRIFRVGTVFLAADTLAFGYGYCYLRR